MYDQAQLKQAAYNGPASTVGGATPRDISTRSNLASIVTQLININGHLSNLMNEHWGHGDQPEPTDQYSGEPLKGGYPTHPELLEQINKLVYSISNRVEYIAARL